VRSPRETSLYNLGPPPSIGFFRLGGSHAAYIDDLGHQVTCVDKSPCRTSVWPKRDRPSLTRAILCHEAKPHALTASGRKA
jgi:hypothetical protein